MPDRNVVLAGVRDLDESEAEALEDSAVQMCDYNTMRAGGVAESIVTHLDAVASRVRYLYLHVDLDVLDPRLPASMRSNPRTGLPFPKCLAPSS